jgi:sugar phosphate isomerase/epimerase
MGRPFRHAMCNEAFQGRSFAAACAAIRLAGYTGVEVAPFTLGEAPAQIGAAQRREYRDIMAAEGLGFAGFHWLMATPKGLHATAPDAGVRRRGWEHIRTLIDLCADLGDGGVMVFGSPQQRCATGGLTPAQAVQNFVEGLASIAPHAGARGVTVAVEALSKDQCDVVQSLAEAVAVVRAVGSPAVQTMFDVHNAIDESEPPAALVDRYFEHIRHVHVNELDGQRCGAGNYDYKPLFEVLRRREYRGWISLEAFDFTPGAETLAGESLRHLEREIAKLPS